MSPGIRKLLAVGVVACAHAGCSATSPTSATDVVSSEADETSSSSSSDSVTAKGIPNAVFRTTPAADEGGFIIGGTPLAVEFNMCQSRPASEDDDLRYTYDFDGDGTVDSRGSCRATHVYETPRRARSCRSATACVSDRRPDGEVCQRYQVCVEGGPDGPEGTRPPVQSTQTFASTNVPISILDVATVTSSNTVSGVGSIDKVMVSFHLTHTFDADLDIVLIAPDGTAVELSTDNGGSADNYGTSCASRTSFDDAAAIAISAGGAPFNGTFRPEGNLAALNGKSGAAANGNWTLRITDDLGGDLGVLQCWSLTITHTN
jgi:subtilisin-like proprotein convertase family protein